jgi:hypothetical protein
MKIKMKMKMKKKSRSDQSHPCEAIREVAGLNL